MARGQSFDVGDVVELKSDGPEMTVRDVHDDESVTCRWWNGRNMDGGIFTTTVLKLGRRRDR